MTEIDWDAVRGPFPVRRMSARSTAALLDNPGCVRRNVLDTANIDTTRLAAALGGEPQFGQSPFALGRGNRFETRVKENDYSELAEVLRSVGFELPAGLGSVQITAPPGPSAMAMRAERTREVLRAIAQGDLGAPNVIDHGVTQLRVGSSTVYLEQDAVAFRQGDLLRICEVKSFPIVDGSADPEKVGAAARQSAVYVASIQDTLDSMGLDPSLVSTVIVLICPRNYSTRPTAEEVDVARELRALRRQLRRRQGIESHIAALDLSAITRTATGPEEVHAASLMNVLPKRYVPECLSRCDLARVCRAEAQAAGEPELLGADAANLLAGVGSLSEAVELAHRSETAGDQGEVAALLRLAQQARLRASGAP
jgi:hypothetical protein